MTYAFTDTATAVDVARHVVTFRRRGIRIFANFEERTLILEGPAEAVGKTVAELVAAGVLATAEPQRRGWVGQLQAVA